MTTLNIFNRKLISINFPNVVLTVRPRVRNCCMTVSVSITDSKDNKKQF